MAPLDLVLTMIPVPPDRFQLSLVTRATGQPLAVQEISVHEGAETTRPGEALVTVTLLADLVAAGTYPRSNTPPAPATPV